MTREWDLIKIDGTEWTYKKEVGRRCYRIFDPSGRDVACLEYNLFITCNELRAHSNTLEFPSHIPQEYIDQLCAVRDLILANPDNDNKISVIELNKKATQDLSRLFTRLQFLYPQSDATILANDLLAKIYQLGVEIDKL